MDIGFHGCSVFLSADFFAMGGFFAARQLPATPHQPQLLCLFRADKQLFRFHDCQTAGDPKTGGGFYSEWPFRQTQLS